MSAPAKIYAKAIELLSRREHSRAELQQKLQKKFRSSGESALTADINDICDRLFDQGYLSDARFAQSYIRARAGKGFGPVRICAELVDKGIDLATAQDLLEEFRTGGFKGEGFNGEGFKGGGGQEETFKRVGAGREECNDRALNDRAPNEEAFTNIDEFQYRLVEVWRKKFAVLPASFAEKSRQQRYLIYRGFTVAQVERMYASLAACDSAREV